MNYTKFIRIFLLVLIVIGAGFLITQKIWVPKLVDKILERSNQQDFEIKYPPGWAMSTFPDVGLWFFQSAPFSENLSGVGIPPTGNMWVSIVKGTCTKSSDDFVYEGPKPDLLYKTVCQEGYQISLGLWQADPQLSEHKAILNEISESFRVLKP